MSEKKYDSTIARIAGNLASGYVRHPEGTLDPLDIAHWSVSVARAIVLETQRTEPPLGPVPPLPMPQPSRRS